MRVFSIGLLGVVAALPLGAATYWVSPTGAASWASAASATPLAGTACASLDTANVNVAAGDVVVLRGGTYTLSGGNNYDNGVAPQTTGSAGNVITYQAHTGETPVIDGSQTYHYGIYLSGKSYVKVVGLAFRDVQSWGSLVNADYIEIDSCVFGPRTGEAAQNGLGLTGGSSHCWIHDNTFANSLSPSGACEEGADLLRIGNGWSIGSVDQQNDYNTVEDNVFTHAAHTAFDNYGRFNVVRRNTFHNEPWIAGCITGQTGKETAYDTSSTSLTVGTGSKSLTVSTGKSYATSSPIGIVSTASPTNAMSGTVTSYNSGTGALVVNVTYARGSGTILSWTLSRGNYPFYEDADYTGKYGHRNVQLSDDYGRDGTFVLVEGNRMGHASNNPGNGGPMNLDCAAPKNIVRHNAIYNGMSAGIYFKYATADCTSAITSSTSLAVGTGTKTFTIATGLHLTAGQTVRVWAVASKTNAMTGTVTSYTSGTGELVTNITDSAGSGTFAAWQIFWNGASGGTSNRVYNNTVFHNGHGYDWRAYGNMNVAYTGVGIAQVNGANTGSTANVIKNNIAFGNKEGAIGASGLYVGDSTPDQVSPETWDTVTANMTSDPLFVDDDLSNPTSLTLPNLALSSGSDAIDAGSALTTVAVSDSGSGTALVVSDALYFQDGSWGSSLSDVVGDWIAVGTVGNVAQIASIDYSTNTITLSGSITRSDGDSVWLYKNSSGDVVLKGAAPDYGAYEWEDSDTTPTAPTSPTATAFRQVGFDASWTDNSNNETGFIVEWSYNGGSTWPGSATVAANVTSYSNRSQPHSQSITVRVRATNGAGDSSNATATAIATAAPAPVGRVRGASGGIGGGL
jgi:hypothetical protein